MPADLGPEALLGRLELGHDGLVLFEEAPDLGVLLVHGLDPSLRVLFFVVDLLDQGLFDLVLGREDLVDALFDVVDESFLIDRGF